jgi:hypothetical protein
MYLPRYGYKIADNFLRYEFISVGTKGEIVKRVSFTRMWGDWYNLGFGDLDRHTGKITDTVVSNNGDTSMVLATVAAIVQEFTSLNKDVSVFATGRTASRNRLYRIGINNYWDTISNEFEILGWRNGKWEPFEKENNYNAFLAVQKKA